MPRAKIIEVICAVVGRLTHEGQFSTPVFWDCRSKLTHSTSICRARVSLQALSSGYRKSKLHHDEHRAFQVAQYIFVELLGK